MQDKLYQRPGQIVDFAFDASVAGVFPDMIRRSVPGYEVVVPLSGLLAARHVKDSGRVYDLGCSLGATTLSLLAELGDTDCEVIAVDNAPAMLAEARQAVSDHRVDFVEADILDVHYERADAIVMNYTLQFVPEARRLELLQRLRAAMSDASVLIVSEKLTFENEDQQSYYRQAHERFKAANGYSDMEIAGKRTALERVMVPDTEQSHIDRFHSAGFTQVETWFRCMNWASFLVRC